METLAFTGGFWTNMTEKVKAIFSMGTGAEFLGLGFIIGRALRLDHHGRLVPVILRDRTLTSPTRS